MLIILNDPAGITGRRRIPFDFGATLQQNIEQHLSGGADAELRINGAIVDPLTDPRMDALPGRADQVMVVLRPRGFDPFSWYAIAAYAAAGAVVLYSAIRPGVPDLGGGGGGKDSPNNKLTGQTNVARAYQAIPDVYGYRRVWPDLIQPSTIEYIDQVKYVTEWLCISRGKGTITSVQYAETPIEDIEGSSYELFEPVAVDDYPENGATTLNDVYEPFASDEVNGQELPYATAFVGLSETGTYNAVSAATSFTIEFTDGPQFDQLKSLAPAGTADISFSYTPGPTLFTGTCTVLSYSVVGPNVTFTFSSVAWPVTTTGSATITITPNGTAYVTSGPFTLPVDGEQIWWSTVFLRGLIGTVVIRAEWWQIDGFGVEVPATRETLDASFAAGTFDQRFYTNKVTPSAGLGRYRIQFSRRSLQVEANGVDVAKLEEVYAVRHYPTKTLPGVTALRVTTKATLSATGFSDRKFNLRWLRHVRELRSDTLSTSRNFARSLLHIWTIAGNDVQGIDVDKLENLNAEMGEDSTLLRFDGSLDDADMSLGERLQFVADTARCELWRDGTRWTFTRDQARQFHEMQFDYRNLAASGDSSLGYSATLPASNDGVEIEYVDETSQSKKAYVRLNISSGAPVASVSRNPRKIRMLGCATLEQATNRAQLEARRMLYQRISVADTSLSDGRAVGIGTLVRWVDPNDFGGDDLQAGEVMSIVGDIITTSEPIEWGGAASGRISFTGSDGRRLGSPIECYPAAGGAVQLSLVNAGLYVADAARQCGSRYAFATGLTADELDAAGLFTVSNIRPSADGTTSLAFASYDPRFYEGDA